MVEPTVGFVFATVTRYLFAPPAANVTRALFETAIAFTVPVTVEVALPSALTTPVIELTETDVPDVTDHLIWAPVIGLPAWFSATAVSVVVAPIAVSVGTGAG